MTSNLQDDGRTPGLGIPALFMRGGTSKGVFFRERDLPPAGPERDRMLLSVMGTPDPLQIDGLGGTTSSTSKVMVIGDPGSDGVVPYTFAQIGIDKPVVDWRGNCGNLTFAVARFVVEEGIATSPVSLLNTNTGIRIDADVAASRSDLIEIAGVPGQAPPITTRYLEPAGAALGSFLPLEHATTDLDVPGVGRVAVSLVDATNPYLFLRLDDLPRASDGVRNDPAFLNLVEHIRATIAVRVGVASSVERARTEASVTPRVILLERDEGDADVTALTVSMQQVHRGIPMTGAMCLAAARAVPGTIVTDLIGASESGITVIRHPLGLTRVTASTRNGAVTAVGIAGTARTLMRGLVYPGA